MALQFRRGLDSDRGTITPLAGEPVFVTDTNKLFIGDGTSAGGKDIVTEALGSVTGHIVPATDSTYDLGDSSKKFRDLYLSGNSIYLGDNLILRNDGGTFKATDSSDTVINISLAANTTSDLAEGNNLYYTTTRSDSDFDVRLATRTTDNISEGSNLYFTNARADARIEATVDSSYVQARQTSGGGGGLDSATTTALIDSSYVQARQIKYTNADFADSAFVTSEINSLIDGAPGTLNTLNEIAAALNDDDSAYSTLVGLINAKSDLDSSAAIALIDSSYVQARQTSGGGGNDSAATIALIDSDYVQARQVDPVSAFTIVSVSGQDDLVADNSEGGANWSTSTETGDLEPNDSVSAQHMGWSTDISDDGLYVVAGAHYNTGPGATQAGRAFIHYYNGSTWSVQQRLDPPGADVVAYLNYGWAVAIDADGDTAAVAARNSNTNGRVYVYTRSSTTWSLQATLSPDTSVSSSGGYFGISVDISEDGNMITVGHQEGRSANGTTRRMGTVEIFTRSGSTWTRAETIEESTSDFPTDAKIGWSNELASEDKDRIIFGAYTDKSAWVWVNSGGWARESELTPSNSASSQNDSYGYAVSINADGTVAAVSDPGADGESSETKAGNVYIFTRSGSTWSQQQRLYSATQAAGDFFGHALNLSGDGTRVYIGVSRQDAATTTEGEVQIWKNTGGTWALESTVTSSDTTSSQNNRFASKNQSVAVTKDAAYLAVGAHEQSSTAGAVYVYTAATGASLSDRLTLEAGSNITITTNATTDTVTIAASSSGLDSAGVTALVDSSYVQARQTTYTNADFADSAFVTAQINNLIDGAPGTLDTLNEIAAALNDDDSAYSTLVGLINAKSDLDSSAAIALIDSAYVQARQTSSGGGNDSATTIALIDSDYVRARQVTPVPSFTKISISGQGDVVADSDEGIANWASSSQQQKLTASDAATNDRFGYDLDISGDGNYALVAAPWENSQRGKAYVYLKSGTSWSQQAMLTADDGGGNDYFGIGTKISEDGSTAVIGAKGAGSGLNGTGKAYVYKRSGTSWTQQAALTASDAADGDLFGYAVDISDDGNTIVLGAYGEDTGGNARGQAYVFTRDSDEGSIWTEDQKFQSDDIEDGDNFGFAVAISGDGNNLVVGVPFEDSNGSSAGSAYVFTRDSSGGSIWSQQAKIQASDAAANQEFAYSVDMSTDGNTIALGSRDDTGGTNRGAAFIFTRSGSTWSQQAKLENANEADYDIFAGGGRGVSLSGTGNALVVGAYGDDDNGSQSGSTFVFTRTGTTWSQAKQIATDDAAASDENGFAVAIDKNGDTVLTGSYGKTSSTGAAYIWTAPLAVQLQDTLTLEAGSGITLTSTSGSDTITIATSSSGLDSAGVTALVDSSYVQARQSGGEITIQEEGSSLSTAATTLNFVGSSVTASGTGTTKTITISDGGNDSATTIALIDSAYVQARQTSGLDSSATTALIDSSYVQARQTSSITSIDSSLSTADSGQVIDSFAAATYRTTKYIAQLSSPANAGYTNWPIATEQQILTGSEAGTPDNIGNGDEFGRGIAIGSNKLLVGATRNDYSTTNAGVAVYYTRDSAEGTWTYQQWVQPSSPGAQDYFGQAIAADSDFDTIAVTGATEGLFILDRSNDSDNTTWSQTFKVIPSSSAYSNAFDHVAISKDGETAITGATYDTTERGKAYIYATDSSGASKAWGLEATLTASNAENYDFFGQSMALTSNGNIALVAATQEDTAGSNAGAVYIFRRTAPNFLLDFGDIGKSSGQYNAYTGPDNNGRDQGFKSFQLSSPVALSEPHGMDLHPDGTKVFITSNANQSRVAMFTLSTAYDMQTASYTNAFSDVENDASAIKGIKFNPDGTKLFVANSTAEADSSGEHAIFQYDLSTAYDLTTASYADKSIDIGTTSRAQDIQFNLDGTKMFVLDDDNAAPNGVREYTLSTAYDISTASYVDIFSVNSQEGSPRGLTFNLDGTKMYVSGNNSEKIFQYSLTTAFDVSTASYDNTYLDAQYETNQLACHRWRDDGSQVFLSNTNQEGISTYYTKNVSWAQDSDFLTVSSSAKLGDQGALAISPDGSYIYAGSYGETVSSVSNAGAVHVWRDSSGSGTYTYDQKLVASDPATNARFGSSLALDGNNLIIGAEGADTYGGAYIFTQGTDGSWTQRKKVSPSDGTAAANKFGGENTVAISGKDVAVGAWNYPSSSKGRAYVFNTTGPNAEARDKGYHSEEILLMHDGTNVAMTSYGKLLLDSDLGTFDGVVADSGSNINLTLSPTYPDTTVKLKAIRTEV